jgi:hypothetical protein
MCGFHPFIAAGRRLGPRPFLGDWGQHVVAGHRFAVWLVVSRRSAEPATSCARAGNSRSTRNSSSSRSDSKTSARSSSVEASGRTPDQGTDQTFQTPMPLAVSSMWPISGAQRLPGVRCPISVSWQWNRTAPVARLSW